MEPRDLSAHDEYRAGRGLEEVARELGRDPEELVALSSNENPFGPSPAAVEAIRETATEANHYPKAAHADLTEALAERWDVTPAQVWLSPGADGAIDYLSRATLEPGAAALVPTPGFSYYPMSTRYHHGTVREYAIPKAEGFPLTADRVLSAYEGERLVYLTSPNNPTGNTFGLDAIERIAAGTDPQTLVVVDEAYGEYEEGPSARRLLDDRDDVAVLRTFSKAYGLAGCRVGYAIVPEAWADAYARVNTPFAVNELGCRAALAALGDDEHVERTVETARWAREYMHEHIEARTWPSQGNFVLAEVGDATRTAAALQERGVIVRDATSFGLPECIRLSCGTREQTRRAVETLNTVLATEPAA